MNPFEVGRLKQDIPNTKTYFLNILLAGVSGRNREEQFSSIPPLH